MTALYSSRWYRVAGLTPRLPAQLRVVRQRVRGEAWYLLSCGADGRSVRLNAAAYAIAGRFDGERTVQQVWDRTLANSDDASTQDEVIELLSQLREASLLQLDRPADLELLLPHLDRTGRQGRSRNLLAWRVPLLDPSALLDRLAPLQLLVFSRGALLLWCAAVAALALLALQHAPTLWAHAQAWLTTPRYALLALLLYAPIKLLHELGHGLAVRRYGGSVREAGITMMLLMPVPYVDASAASAFVRRRQRVVVGAAGIMVELALAAIALPLWLWLAEGWWRDIAFVTVAVAGVSTLLFNANPLQRLDGYYLLADVFELPNLAPRSRSWWLDLLRRRVLRLPGAEAMPLAPAERPWLAAYAPSAWLYGLGVAALAISWLAQLSLVLGVLAAVLLGWQILVAPARRLLRELRRAALQQHATARRWRRGVLAGAAVLALLLFVPMPQRTLVQGVVWPAEQAQLRAEEDGTVESVEASSGAWVQPGDRVAQLSNPELQARHARQAARVDALETELQDALPRDGSGAGATRAGDVAAELAAGRAELERLRERVAALTVRAHTAGRVALPRAADLAGSYLRRGSLLGQVLTGEPPTVRLALPEADAADLRRQHGEVSVRLAGSPHVAHAGALVRDSGAAVLQLPSAALSTRHGGQMQTDPADRDDLKSLQPVVLLDVTLSSSPDAPADRIGERAWVRLDAGASPLLLQLAQALQRRWQRHVNPQF